MSFRILLSAALAAAFLCAGPAVVAAPAAPAVKPALAKFGLTQAVATLQACPNARFEGDSMMALGGVLQENQARINAVPVEKRMDLMTKLVADETAKANTWRKANKLDCTAAAELSAGYWNRSIQSMAIAEQAEHAKRKNATVPAAAGVKPTPKPATGVPVTLP